MNEVATLTTEQAALILGTVDELLEGWEIRDRLMVIHLCAETVKMSRTIGTHRGRTASSAAHMFLTDQFHALSETAVARLALACEQAAMASAPSSTA